MLSDRYKCRIYLHFILPKDPHVRIELSHSVRLPSTEVLKSVLNLNRTLVDRKISANRQKKLT
jgi:hypothetical protein